MVVEATAIHASLASTKILVEAAGEWKGRKPRAWQVNEFRKLVNNNAVLGFNALLRRPRYATTPIITAMGNCDDFGAVSVVHVGPSMGKTTAANYFLRMNKRQLRGIAICRTNVGIPYTSSMLELLGLDPVNPPPGWLSCLVDALNEDSDDQHRQSVMVLDEFVCSEDQFEVESSLIMSLKALLRGSRTRVIVLTPSKEYASFLISKNELQGIVPLTGTYPLDQYPNGEWVSMHWSISTMKVAARQLPYLLDRAPVEIDTAIDHHYQGLSEQEQRPLTLVKLEKVLVAALKPPTQTLDQKNIDVTVSNELDEYDQGCSMANCSIF